MQRGEREGERKKEREKERERGGFYIAPAHITTAGLRSREKFSCEINHFNEPNSQSDYDEEEAHCMHTYTAFVQGDNLSWKCHSRTGMNTS